jgi:hypothetical protein
MFRESRNRDQRSHLLLLATMFLKTSADSLAHEQVVRVRYVAADAE